MRLIYLILFLFITSCIVKNKKEEMIKIFYIPIGVETYVPITTDNIEDSYVNYGLVKVSNSSFKKVIEIMSNSSTVGNLDKNNIRVKIIWPNGEVSYIDNSGGFLLNGSDQGMLKDKSFKKVKKLLEKITNDR